MLAIEENNKTVIKVTSNTKLEIENPFSPGVSGFKTVSTTGIGLYTVACILNRLNGYCDLETSENSFTSKIILPS